MKKLKIVAGVVLGIFLIIGVWLLIRENTQAVPKNYYNIVNTGGSIESTYIKKGPYEVSDIVMKSDEDFKVYEIWYPTEMDTENGLKKYPAVIVNNGTGVKASRFKAFFEHLASWGFIVIGTEESFSWDGYSSEKCMKRLMYLNEHPNIDGLNDNIFAGNVDMKNIGVYGHSQGAIGAINAATVQVHKDKYKAMFLSSLPDKKTVMALRWKYDVRDIKIPTIIMAGTGKIDKNIIITPKEMQDAYDSIAVKTKLIARRNDAEHKDMLYFADGYVTAFFMWQLQHDRLAATAFRGEAAEILNNKYYQSIQKNF